MAKKNRLFTSTVACLFLVVILAYANHFGNSFHFDDGHCIQDNPYVRSLKNIPLFFSDVRTFSVIPQHQSYRPLLTTTFAVDYWIAGGFNTTVFHVTSFLFFLFQCIFLYFIFLKVLNNDRYFALFGTAVYALHTAMAETVNYISARSDILSTFLIVLALYLYMYSKRSRAYYLYLIPAALSAFAKETVFIFPVILGIYIVLFEKNKKSLWKQLWPSVFIVVVMGILSYSMLSKDFEPSNHTRWSYILAQPYSLLYYFMTFLFPFHLSADTDWTVVTSLFDKRVFIGGVFLAGLIAFIIYSSKKKNLKPVTFGLLWFLIACFPSSSGIVPLAEVINDHRMFFPFIGLSLCFAWLLKLLFNKYSRNVKAKWAIISVMVLLLLAHAVGVHNRNKTWLTEETLWADVTIKSPKNGRGLMNYGLTQMAKGDYNKADYYFTKALAYTPYYSTLFINLGILKHAMGDNMAAERYFVSAVRYGRHLYEPYYYYSDFLHSLGRYDEQEKYLEQSLLLSPISIPARQSMMQLYSDQRRWKELEQFCTETLVIDPQNQLAKDLLFYINRVKSIADKLSVTLKQSKNKSAYSSLIALYYELGEYDKCINVSQDALSKYPKLLDAEKYQCLSYKVLSITSIPKYCKNYL